jgi:Tfp pilus assembly protein FimT
MEKKRNAHTLIELIVIVMILAALALIAVPRLRIAAIYREQADTVARKIVTDLRRTRQLAISNAATNSTGFTLSRTGSTYQIIDDSNSATVDSHTIAPQISCGGGTDFSFGPLGNLRASSTPLTVSAEGKTFTISVTPATGMIKCAED